MITVKPALPHLIVRDPHSKMPVPSGGGLVPETSYWHRRILDGSVILVIGSDEKPAPPAPLETDQ